MKTNLENNVLTLYLGGEINSYNADNIEKEILETLSKEKFNQLVLDFSSVTYISSAGLRIMLKLKQQYPNFSIVETSLEVYDIFSMTGFSNFLNFEN